MGDTATVETCLRDAARSDLEALVQIWQDGWRDAHGTILPRELAQERSPENLRNRLVNNLDSVRVLDGTGPLRGFHWVRGNELFQFYVAADARGRGYARKLMEDGESRLCGAGNRDA